MSNDNKIKRLTNPLALVADDNAKHRELIIRALKNSKFNWEWEEFKGSYTYDNVLNWTIDQLRNSRNYSLTCLHLDLSWISAEEDKIDGIKEQKVDEYIQLLLCPESANARLAESQIPDGLRVIKTLAQRIVDNFAVVAISTFGSDALKVIATRFGADYTVQKFPDLKAYYDEPDTHLDVLESRFRSDLGSALHKTYLSLHGTNEDIVPTEGIVTTDFDLSQASEDAVQNCRTLLGHIPPGNSEPLALDYTSLAKHLGSFWEWLDEHFWYSQKQFIISAVSSEVRHIGSEKKHVFGPSTSKMLDKNQGLIESQQPILILGDSEGTNEKLAEEIHRRSAQSSPFVVASCHGRSDDSLINMLFGENGKCAHARGGTLFVERIADASPEIHKRLHRLIQDGDFETESGRTLRSDARVVLSSLDRNLEKLVVDNNFHGGLLIALRARILHIQPLNERSDEIPWIANQMLAEIGEIGGKILRLDGKSEKLLKGRSWRDMSELKSVLQRACVTLDQDVISSDVVESLIGELATSDAKLGLTKAPKSDFYGATTLDELSVAFIKETLETLNGNKTAAAKKLGISRGKLYKWIDTHKIEFNSDDDTAHS